MAVTIPLLYVTAMWFPDRVRTYLRGDHLRATSHFAASCGGAPLPVIAEYLESQKPPA
ncbi:hypothetical protein Airi02_043570 [Actinoallomurus iriomotensis]|uniref:Transposase n=1 Tax=Actinoallomurus iriomotensis TaxID=478107 RepID=A0A9W6S3D8_9ACTN|nr:hypothetical protein Airi02_043570 [Actinoallomurus iriomotensis]